MIPQITLKLHDRWLWDFWLAKDGPDYHLFYLQAPNNLPEQTQRHINVSIGHAVSLDLRRWIVMPDALKPAYPGDRGDADEFTTWTGSIIRHDHLWYMFYTCTYREEDGKIQRVALATSTNLINWTKHPRSPLISADSQWYEMLDYDLCDIPPSELGAEYPLWCNDDKKPQSWGYDQSWRDPWVFQDRETGRFHALITARHKEGPLHFRGAIAQATSDNLIDWQVGPPVTKLSYFGSMECPQLVELEPNRYYLFFSSDACYFFGNRLIGTFYMIADNPFGPFSEPKILFADSVGLYYSGKVVKGPYGYWYFMTWRYLGLDESFYGDLVEPIPISIRKDGSLFLLDPASIIK